MRGKIECFGLVYMELYVKKENMKSFKYCCLVIVLVIMFLWDFVKVIWIYDGLWIYSIIGLYSCGWFFLVFFYVYLNKDFYNEVDFYYY